MTIAKAVKSNSDGFIGVIVVDMSVDFMDEYFKNVKLMNTSFVLLVDKDGNIIVNNEIINERTCYPHF